MISGADALQERQEDGRLDEVRVHDRDPDEEHDQDEEDRRGADQRLAQPLAAAAGGRLEAVSGGGAHARLPGPAGVDRDGGDDDDAADHVLEEGIDLQLVERVVEHREDEDAADGAEHPAAAARERGAAEHHGRDRLEVVAALLADRRRARAEPAGEEQARQRGAERADDVGEDDRAVRAHAGEARDLLVAADRVQAEAEARVAQQEVDDRHDAGEQEHRHRDDPEARVAEVLERLPDGPRRTVVAVVHVALDDQPGAERRDERVDAELRDHEAVAEPDDDAERDDGEDARDHVGVLAVHHLGGDQRAEADHVRDREVERAGEDDDGLAGRDDAERDGALQHVHDVADGQERCRRRS